MVSIHADSPGTVRRTAKCSNLIVFQLSQLADVPSLINIGTKQATVSVPVVNSAAVLSPGIVLATLAFLASWIVCAEGGVGRLRRTLRNHAARIIQVWWRRLHATNDSGFRHVVLPSRLLFITPDASIEDLPTSTTTTVGDNPIQSIISPDFHSEEANHHIVEDAAQRHDYSNISPPASGDALSKCTVSTDQKDFHCKELDVQSIVESTQQMDCVPNICGVTLGDSFVESAPFEGKARIQSTPLVSGHSTPSDKNGRDSQSESTMRKDVASISSFKFNDYSVPAEFSFHEKKDFSKESIESVFTENRVIDDLEMTAISVLASFANRSAIDYSPESVADNQSDVDEDERKHNAAIRIQRSVRAWLLERRRKAFAVEVQSDVKSSLSKKVIEKRQAANTQRRRLAALIIQNAWRAHLARKRFLEIREKVVVLQAFWRQILVRRALAQRLAKERSVVIIQCWWRSIQQRRVFLLQRHSAIVIQSWWRSTLMERRRQKLLSLQTTRIQAAIVIQRHVRTFLSRRREATAAAYKMQHWWRVCLLRKRIDAAVARNRELVAHRKNSAVSTIQRAWRLYKQRKELKERSIVQQTNAARIIQRAWKAYCQRRRLEMEEQAAILIQRSWRASRLRIWLYHRRRAALVIQAAWRGYKARSSVAKATSVCAAALRKRLSVASKQAKEQPQNRLGVRAQRALANLLRYTSVTSVLDALGHLETATRLSREVCTWLLTVPSSSTPCGHNEYLPHVLLRLLHLCNRSVADEEVALAAVSVMLNLVNNVDHRRLDSSTSFHNIWWQQHECDSAEFGSTTNSGDSINSKSIVEFLFICLQRLSRSRIGTGSVRLFARTAALLAKLCIALRPDFEIPTHFIRQIELLLPSVRRLWSATLSRNPVRAEVTALIRNYKVTSSRREFLLRRVDLELNLERLPSKPSIDPLVACELLMLTLHEHRFRQRQCSHHHLSVRPGSPF
ncbi:unnamed protein product [Rodentolepis nana]|uniref:Calponin-homology (CH) domain-containing protein n=1 Tax=Rodentolepis nana TaxID=102285 RepID=A0A0R3T8Z5_RODNA|nr:unnamed protein product [Rodentolepis nana]